MAKRSVTSAGRTAIAVFLIGFVLVTTGVITRRVYGVQQQRAIENMKRTRDALSAERIRLESAIRDASSRVRLQAIAEQQLNMHIPKPDQMVYLKRPPKPPAVPPVPHDSI